MMRASLLFQIFQILTQAYINASVFLAHTSPSSLPWQMVEEDMDEMGPAAIGHSENRISQSGENALWNVRNEFPPHTPSPIPWKLQEDEEGRSRIEDGFLYNLAVDRPNLSFLTGSYEEEAMVSAIDHIEGPHNLDTLTNSSKDEMDKGDEKDSDIAREKSKSEAAETDHETPIVPPDHLASSSSKQHIPSRAERRQMEWQKKQREQYLKIQEKNQQTKTKSKKRGRIK